MEGYFHRAVVLCLSVATCTAVSKKSGWTCDFEGTRYNDGENFTISQSGPCISYQCKGGSVHTLKTACIWNGNCREIGETWTEQCLTYGCENNNGAIGVKIIKGGCIIEGTCLGVGQEFQQGCFNYTCQQKDVPLGISFRLLLKEWGCSLEGKCVPGNFTVSHSCITQRCENRNGKVGMYILTEACKAYDNSCIGIGKTFVEKCRTFKCSVQELLGVRTYSIQPIRALCEDSDGVCHGEGETFSIRLNNDITNNCTCTVTNSNPSYKCQLAGR